MASKLRGWILDTIWKFKVNDGTDRTIFDEAGYLYQRNTKITASATNLNAVTAGVISSATAAGNNTEVTEVDGSEGSKACAVNGLTLIEGGTGIADLTLAAPTAGAVAILKLDSVTSGNIVVTCATGVTFDGTNDIATLDAAGESLILFYKSATEWAIAMNVGSVALSSSE